MAERTRSFGRTIAFRRAELGLTQARLAERAGVSTHSVIRAEAGRRGHLTTIYALAKALELDPYLLFDDEEETV